jgi:hypothetical protein
MGAVAGVQPGDLPGLGAGDQLVTPAPLLLPVGGSLAVPGVQGLAAGDDPQAGNLLCQSSRPGRPVRLAANVSSRTQDEATRAWNLHVALYYKAGGVPWRLRRASTDLPTCYVGISFYRAAASGTLDTAVAHIFSERGEGVIVRGGTAHVSGEDRQPHLLAADASSLLANALAVYKREHHTLPARVVIHKSSRFTAGENDGFTAAADDRDLHALDLVWVTSSEDALIFRPGNAPPLRGTFMTLGPAEHLIYTKGSVDFYSTCPGMYVPRPLGLRPARLTISPRELGTEVLALSKMNWNQSRLDARLPITLKTADQVKHILRFCDPAQQIASRYAEYM